MILRCVEENLPLPENVFFCGIFCNAMVDAATDQGALAFHLGVGLTSFGGIALATQVAITTLIEARLLR